MSIKQIQINECRCDKCQHVWETHVVPVLCPKCKTKKWNARSEKNDEPRSAASGNLVDNVPEMPSTEVAELEIDEPTIDEDHGWIEMPTTFENGEILYWRRKLRGKPICYKRESDFGGA